MDLKKWYARYNYFEGKEEKWLSSDLIKAEQSDNANLIIGLGGSGLRVISAVQDEMFANIAPKLFENEESLEAAYPRTRFLYVDRETEAKSGIKFPLTTGFSLGRYRDNIAHVEMDTGVFRKAARKGFEDRRHRLFDVIRQFIYSNKDRRIQVHIIAGFGGNTGSGVFLSLAFLVQEVLADFSIESEIYGYFFLQPHIEDVQYGAENENVAFNIISALLELDYCMKMPWNKGVWLSRSTGSFFANPPFKNYFLAPVNYVGEMGDVFETVARYITQYLKKETAGALYARGNGSSRSAEAILSNTSAGNFLVFLRGIKSNSQQILVRRECASLLLYLIKGRKKNAESVDMRKSGLAQDFSLGALIPKIEDPLNIYFGNLHEGLVAKTAELLQIQEEYDSYTNNLLIAIKGKASSFINDAINDMIDKYMPGLQEHSSNVYVYSKMLEDSIRLFDERIQSALDLKNSQLDRALLTLAEAEGRIHTPVITHQKNYLLYRDALEHYKKAQIFEIETEIVINVWKRILFYMREIKRTSIDRIMRVLNRCEQHLSEISALATTNYELKERNSFTTEEAVAFDQLLSRCEQELLNGDQYGYVNYDIKGECLACYLVDQAVAYEIEKTPISKQNPSEDILQNEPLQTLFWRKDDPSLESASVLFLHLPEEEHFKADWVKKLDAQYVVIPVVTHRPGTAECYGFRIIPQLFNREMDLDYLHMLRIENQDAAVWMRSRIVRRIFAAHEVSNPEKAYVSKIKSLQIPEDAAEPVRRSLADFKGIITLSIPVETAIKENDILEGMDRIESVRFIGSEKVDLSRVYFPETLRELDMQGLFMHELPESLTSLRRLEKLDLQDAHLETMHPSILNLAERIGFTGDERDRGICIKNLVIDDMNPAVLLGPVEALRRWFENRETIGEDIITEAAEEIAEIKVIFLGDGEVGKTRTIRRILRDGEQFAYTEDRTPGILISDKICRINNRDIKIHFWDFGGQDIFYSTHRMFMTRQTVYVILLNARESNLDERARYWLYNVAHFAGKDVPVLLVINKTDLNADAFVSSSLQDDDSPKIRGILRLSNETFDREQFREAIIEPLYRIIGEMRPVTNELPESWRLLAGSMQNSNASVLRESDVRNMLPDAMKSISRKELGDLLEWFNQIGVSFSYRTALELADFIVLDPKWVTNAIYIILANGRRYNRNGLLKTEDLKELLLEEKENDVKTSKDSEPVICIDPTIHYRDLGEVSFVLEVIRYFHLSFRLDKNTEFIPALCFNNRSVRSEEVQKDPTALHFKYEYDYLPRHILHRLMVELHVYLDVSSVAREAAVFELKDRGMAAAVSMRGKILDIYIVCKEAGDAQGVFLEIIRGALADINAAFDFSPKEYIVHTEDGKSADFDYNELISMREHSSKNTVYSSVFKRDILLEELLNPVSQEERVWSEFWKELMSACRNLQSHEQSKFGDEVKCNVYICDQLRMAGRNAVTEHLGGQAGSGKTDKYGERDITIFDENGREQYILEALNLSYKPINHSTRKYLNKKYLKDHLEKLLNNYNPNGLQYLCLINYVNMGAADFQDAWYDYLECIRQENPGRYIVQNTIEETKGNSNFIHTAVTRYSVGGAFAKVYHVFMLIETDNATKL